MVPMVLEMALASENIIATDLSIYKSNYLYEYICVVIFKESRTIEIN